LIWVQGQIVPDGALRISVLDRTFEHGLGLFETFRTWNGHPTLLHRHLERLSRSARELSLPLRPSQLPDSQAVSQLIEANRASLTAGQDVRLRLTLSGGLATLAVPSSVLWMTAGPLPPPIREPGAVITHCIQVTADDPLSRHKTLNYWRKRIAHAQAIEDGTDEVICLTPDRLVCEASRANVFLVDGHRLITPGIDGPLLPGIMRRVVLEQAARMGLEVEEGPLPAERLFSADAAFLTSSLRGILPIARLMEHELPAPGPVTGQLRHQILVWLEAGG
jgi:branched-subunit amino acid aminotransferase/4-amino-4-deoxychorismate lyase